MTTTTATMRLRRAARQFRETERAYNAAVHERAAAAQAARDDGMTCERVGELLGIKHNTLSELTTRYREAVDRGDTIKTGRSAKVGTR